MRLWLTSIFFPKYKVAIKAGINGALIMITYVVVLELLTKGQAEGLKFLKYILFAFPIALGLSKLDLSSVCEAQVLPNSAFYTAVASFTAAILMVAAYWVTLPIEHINMATVQTTHIQTVSDATKPTWLSEVVLLFFEVFAMSIITGFTILLYGSNTMESSEKQS